VAGAKESVHEARKALSNLCSVESQEVSVGVRKDREHPSTRVEDAVNLTEGQRGGDEGHNLAVLRRSVFMNNLQRIRVKKAAVVVPGVRSIRNETDELSGRSLMRRRGEVPSGLERLGTG
jgi:hypothetical protein